MWRNFLALVCLLTALLPGLSARPAAADPGPVLGLWLVEDKDGVIEIHACGDALCGRLYWMAEPRHPDGSIKRDDHNPDPARRRHPVCGLDLLTGFKPDGPDHWDEGRAYDPHDGSTYHAEMRLAADGTLRLRGYIGIPLLGATQTWTRAAADTPRCPDD